ncbi:hypothetical protein AB0C77_38630, partial [Streptomyces sp. NPDC048629]|uniref:hypothetical protein n=1 Tax=Streptomyces sp. NPDC048629 TaxID=3154824 RepID=UPI003441663A
EEKKPDTLKPRFDDPEDNPLRDLDDTDDDGPGGWGADARRRLKDLQADVFADARRVNMTPEEIEIWKRRIETADDPVAVKEELRRRVEEELAPRQELEARIAAFEKTRRWELIDLGFTPHELNVHQLGMEAAARRGDSAMGNRLAEAFEAKVDAKRLGRTADIQPEGVGEAVLERSKESAGENPDDGAGAGAADRVAQEQALLTAELKQLNDLTAETTGLSQPDAIEKIEPTEPTEPTDTSKTAETTATIETAETIETFETSNMAEERSEVVLGRLGQTLDGLVEHTLRLARSGVLFGMDAERVGELEKAAVEARENLQLKRAQDVLKQLQDLREAHAVMVGEQFPPGSTDGADNGKGKAKSAVEPDPALLLAAGEQGVDPDRLRSELEGRLAEAHRLHESAVGFGADRGLADRWLNEVFGAVRLDQAQVAVGRLAALATEAEEHASVVLARFKAKADGLVEQANDVARTAIGHGVPASRVAELTKAVIDARHDLRLQDAQDALARLKDLTSAAEPAQQTTDTQATDTRTPTGYAERFHSTADGVTRGVWGLA